MFGRRLSGTVDFYNNNFSDVLQTRGKSIALLGASYPTENIGKQRRSGIEIELGWQDHIGALNYYVNGNWTLEKTKMITWTSNSLRSPISVSQDVRSV